MNSSSNLMDDSEVELRMTQGKDIFVGFVVQKTEKMAVMVDKGDRHSISKDGSIIFELKPYYRCQKVKKEKASFPI